MSDLDWAVLITGIVLIVMGKWFIKLILELINIFKDDHDDLSGLQ